MRKIWIWAIILVALVAAAGTGVWRWRVAAGNSTTYQTATVMRGDMIQSVTASGQLNPVVTVQVGSQISGIIDKLFVDFNSIVTQSQVVAQINASTYRANVMQAEGDLENAKAALELAKVTAVRTKELCAKDGAPQSSLDKVMADLAQAEAVIKIKQGALDKARVDLANCTIYAPIDGIVISRNVDVGQTVAASLSAPTVFVIANDLSKMQIDANVAEADIGNVEMGQDVDFTVDAFPYRVFHGKVTQVRNAAVTVQNVVSYDTVIEVKNSDLKLRPGMTANVSIIIAHRENAVEIGNAALRVRWPGQAQKSKSPTAAQGAGGSAGKPTGGEGKRTGKAPEQRFERTVYVVTGDGREPQPRTIKIGITDGMNTEVTEGLKDGEVVVTAVTGGANATSAAQSAASNPFGGGMRRF